ncbi:hypothetical protein, partial [Vibrio parahaemolyticus]|uniref:hypothetical protein n=1 Tax=Vibrio parahaemolyticus TaxID=670 RepID=UPI001C2FC656
ERYLYLVITWSFPQIRANSSRKLRHATCVMSFLARRRNQERFAINAQHTLGQKQVNDFANLATYELIQVWQIAMSRIQ